MLLSFGENGWDDALVRREDAAGFGFASLARRNCAVSSRPRSPDGEMSPGWRVELLPEHFLGETDAEVRAHEETPYPHGTAISFQATESIAAIRNAAETAARHYPLPVVFEDATDADSAPEELPRRAFLDGGVHAEPWRGLVFGVFKDRRSGYNDPDLNFFGLTLPVRLPSVETVHGPTWSVLADVADCPDLELVLPARKEAVENAFLTEMREAARLAIYRAMASDPEPRPAFEDRARAREAGIDIAPPPPRLRPWRPSVADCNDWREPGKLADAGPDSSGDALVMDCDPEPPEAQALWRAAERAGIASRLFEADRRLDGYGWYDALDRVTEVAVRVAAGDDWMALDAYPLPESSRAPVAPLPSRPAAIRIGLAVGSGIGAGAHHRPAGRSGLRRRGLVLDRGGHAAGDGRQRPPTAPPRHAAHGGVLLPVRRCRLGQLGDPAQPLRGGRAAPGDAAIAVERRRLPGFHRRGRPARADLVRTARPHRRYPHPAPRRHRDPRRRRGGRVVSRLWTVQTGYAAWYANTVTVEADTLDEALEKAIEAANEDAAGWRVLDHCGDTFVQAVSQGVGVDPWGEGSLPVPDRFSEHGEPPVVTLAGPVPPGAVRVSGGRVTVRFETEAGTIAAEMRDPPHPPANKPLVTVSVGPDCKPRVEVEGGSARVRILDG